MKISSFNFFTKSWAFIPNGPAVSKSKLQWPRIESDITQQQNQRELPEGRLFTKCNSVCLDINEQNGFGSRSIIFTYMQTDITPTLNSVFSYIAIHKETNNTKKEPNNPHHKEIRDHRKDGTCRCLQQDNGQSTL